MLGVAGAHGAGEDKIIPLTYMNSTAAIKAFCGERGGLVCTSSNAAAAFDWAFARREKILFLPDQHLGRNTAYAMGIPLNEMVVWDPWQINGGVAPERLRAAKVILWKGHCSVHQRFLPSHVDAMRAKYPGIQVIVHPECRWEVCQKADALGSTERLIELVEEAPEGSTFAIGTEIHLVNRLAKQFASRGKHVMTLDDTGCLCTTMYRISPQHLAWALENLVEGRVVNRIQVDRGCETLGQGCAGPHARDRRSRAEGAAGGGTGPRGDSKERMKTFTLEEANALLPVVESLLGQVIAAKEEAERLESEIQSLRQRIFLSGGMTVDIAGVARNRTEGEAQVQRAKEVLAEMDSIGVQVKDLDTGLLDFPCRVDGELVLLCWRRGESRIEYWHTLEAGFRGRQPLDARFGHGWRDRPN